MTPRSPRDTRANLARVFEYEPYYCDGVAAVTAFACRMSPNGQSARTPEVAETEALSTPRQAVAQRGRRHLGVWITGAARGRVVPAEVRMRGFWGKTKAAWVVAVGLCGTLAVVESGHAEGWRLGADLFGGSFYVGSYGIFGLENSSLTGTGVGIERALSPSVWLFGSLAGSFSESDKVSIQTGDLTLGARFVANPEDRVHIGWTVALAGTLGASDTKNSGFRQRSDIEAVTLKVGVTADLTLTESLELRVSADLAEVGYQHHSDRYTSPDPATGSSLGAGGLYAESGVVALLGLSPKIGLGLRF